MAADHAVRETIMHSRSFALLSVSAVALGLCSCSENGSQRRNERQNPGSDVNAPPEIALTSAPGVAFNYAYEFSLPDAGISSAQEAHASACENLGLTRCRITGMSYSVDQNEQVTAELDVKLDPAIARQFGKSAQQTVVSHDGRLVRLDIGSSDEGAKINTAAGEKSSVMAQIAELQLELAKATPGSAARSNLLSQIQALQSQASEQSHTIAASQAALASAPMEFHYYGRGGVPGFRGNPLRAAWQTLVTVVVELVGLLLQTLAVLLPLGLLLALLITLWRTRPLRAVRKWIKGQREATD